MTTEAAKPQSEPEKKKRHRSPNYPAVSLRDAIDRLKKFVSTDGKAGAKSDMAAKHIGFAAAHGWAYSVLSALKKYGLVEEKDGRVVPTPRGLEIVSLPEKDERRLAAIRQAAVLPPIYAELIEQYRVSGLPSDETLEGELKAYRGFNPNTVKDFLNGFKETLEFAGLTDISVLGSDSKAEAEVPKVKIGDFVQWESQGMLQFREPKRVKGFSDDGKFVFVDGSPTGMPIAEVSVEEAIPPGNPPKPHANVFQREARNSGASATMKQDVFSLTEGEVVLSWPTPLSGDSIADLKDWLKIVERKISRSLASDPVNTEDEQ